MSSSPQRPISEHDDATRVQPDGPPQTLEFAVDSTNPSFGAVPVGGVPDYPFLSSPQAADEIGRLGEYRILKKLGEGGMGFVFRGEDPALKRFIALKVMRPEVAAKPMATDRFLREGRAAAGLKSDHIITIYQVGQANGVPFLAMEFLEGLPLDEWFKLQKKAIPLPHVLRVVRDTLRGLATAHDKGLIHRDIKPANLWLEKGTSRIKILDFGLTRGNEADMQLTQEGAVVGTPAFMAPEQASGKPVDPRADLFSVGVVMYTLLAGKNPFARGSLMETLGAVGFETQAPITTVRSDVPKEYSDFLDRLLAKSPDARPANAKAALQELATIEKNLQDGNRTLLATAASQPMVVVPLSAPAPQVWDELTDLDDAPPARPTRTKDQGPPKPPTNKKLLYGGGLFALLAVLGGIVIIITNKDGTQTKVEVPDGAKVEVKDKGKTVASVGGRKDSLKPLEMDPDRKAAEWAIGKGGFVELVGGIRVEGGKTLPVEPFKISVLSVLEGVVDADLDRLRELNSLVDVRVGGPITNAGAERLASFPAAPKLHTLVIHSPELTDETFSIATRFSALEWIRIVGPKLTSRGLAQLKGHTLTGIDMRSWTIRDEELEFLKDLPRLKSVSLLKTAITNVGLKNLAELPMLQELELSECPNINDAGLKQLVALKGLTYLDISRGDLGGAFTSSAFQSIGVFPELKQLLALGIPTVEADLSHLVGLQKLESLKINPVGLTDAGLETIAKLKALKDLGSIKGSKVTAEGVKKFRAALPACKVETDFDIDPDRAAAEKLLPMFELVIVPDGKVTETTLKPGSAVPAGAFKIVGIRVLNQAPLPHSFAEDVYLPAIAPLTHLRFLDDIGPRIWMMNADPKKWAAIASRTTLNRFGLAVPLSDAWIEALQQFPNLTSIHIRNGDTLPVGFFTKLKALKLLRIIRVYKLTGRDRWEAITALPLSGLSPSIAPDMDTYCCERVAAMSDLETFNLYSAELTPEMLNALGASRSIQTVTLGHSKIPAKGFDRFARMPNLSSLTIVIKEFDDTHLAQLTAAPSLRKLVVKETSVTEAGVKALAAKLPNCTIEWSGGRVKGQ